MLEPPPHVDRRRYIAKIRVEYMPDGSLATARAAQSAHRPESRALADSAMRAVRRCNPLRIPPKYAPYYDQWKRPSASTPRARSDERTGRHASTGAARAPPPSTRKRAKGRGSFTSPSDRQAIGSADRPATSTRRKRPSPNDPSFALTRRSLLAGAAAAPLSQTLGRRAPAVDLHGAGATSSRSILW